MGEEGEGGGTEGFVNQGGIGHAYPCGAPLGAAGDPFGFGLEPGAVVPTWADLES